MFYTLKEIFSSLGEWRAQIFHLALLDLHKTVDRAVLGWLWLFVKPAMYIFCFWFALYLGIRANNSDMTGTQYLIWLAAGIIPWLCIQDTIGVGSDTFHRYSYLVNKLKFPVPLIPIFYELSLLLLHLMLLACLILGFFLAGGQISIYMVQLPIIIIILYVFCLAWSMLLSPLCAVSKDVFNLVKALSTPIFWLSGVLFPIQNVDSPIVQTIALFNPVTFIVTCYRKVLSFGVEGADAWMWGDPTFFLCGIGTILVTLCVGLAVYGKLHKDIPDVL